MKTRYMIAAASALLLLAGCAREMDFQTPGSSVLRAVIEQNETRVSFDAMGKFTWDEGDQIAVYVGDAFENVTVDAATGAFQLTSTEDRSFYAVYPAAAAPSDNTALTVTLPTSYDISGVSDTDFSPVPMVAQNIQGQDELYFLHVGGLVRIFGQVDAPASTAVVTFDKDVTGTYTVDVSNASAPTITTNGNTTDNTVTFTLPNTTSFVLNVPVPCGTYTNVSISLDGGTAQKLNTADLTFARHHGKTLEIGAVTFEYKIEGTHDVLAEYVGGTKEFAQAFSSYKTPDGGATKVAVPFELEFSQDPFVADPNTGDQLFPWVTTPPDWITVADGVDYTGSTTGEPIHLVLTTQLNTAVDYHANELASRDEVSGFDLSKFDPTAADGAPGSWTNPATNSTTANCYVVQAPGSFMFPVVYGNGIVDGNPNEIAWHAKNGIGGEWRTDDEVIGTTQDIDSDLPFTMAWGHLAYLKDHWDRNITSPYIMKHLENVGDVVSEYKVEIVWMDVLRNNGSGPLNGRLLLRNVQLVGEGENAYITFDVPAESIEQGNVLIALKADGVVVWCWHIWVTDTDLRPLAGPNGYNFAPVNMGWRDTRETSRYDERIWYVRVKQTETDGITSDVYEVKSLAGNITIEYGGRSMTYPQGRNAPRVGPYMQKVGENDPAPKSGSAYVGYGVPSSGAGSYVTSPANVPELLTPWVYEDYATPRTGETYGEQAKWYGWDDPKTIQQETNINLLEPLTVGLGIRYPRVNFGGSRQLSPYNVAWHNLWDTSENSTTYNDHTIVGSTKTIYDPCPVGYKVPTWVAFEGFNTGNMPYATVDGVTGRMYGGNLFFPFIPSTSNAAEMARYATNRFTGANSRVQFDIYPDYVYGRTTEAWTATYVVRAVQE